MLGRQHGWATAELAPWRKRGLKRARLDDAVAAAAAQHGGTFRYDVHQDGVVFHAKSGAFLGPDVDADIVKVVAGRAAAYHRLLIQALPLLRIEAGFSIALDVSDTAPHIPDLPLFSFQKPAGSALILVPDVDLLALNFLEGEEWDDPLPFLDKANKAIFVGASTGGFITREEITRLGVPRLRAAVAFKGNPHVAFTLSSIVQYDTPQTKRAVEELGVTGPVLSWDEQLAYRHILSMDGNGATWSRVAKILHSNSVLMKYDSPHQLFYYQGLRPWTHYVPIAHDSEVEPLVLACATNPARYQRIAHNGQRFFQNHLRREHCLDYLAGLLQAYMDILDDGDGRPALRARTHYQLWQLRRRTGRAYAALRRQLP